MIRIDNSIELSECIDIIYSFINILGNENFVGEYFGEQVEKLIVGANERKEER